MTFAFRIDIPSDVEGIESVDASKFNLRTVFVVLMETVAFEVFDLIGVWDAWNLEPDKSESSVVFVGVKGGSSAPSPSTLSFILSRN